MYLEAIIESQVVRLAVTIVLTLWMSHTMEQIGSLYSSTCGGSQPKWMTRMRLSTHTWRHLTKYIQLRQNKLWAQKWNMYSLLHSALRQASSKGVSVDRSCTLSLYTPQNFVHRQTGARIVLCKMLPEWFSVSWRYIPFRHHTEWKIGEICEFWGS